MSARYPFECFNCGPLPVSRVTLGFADEDWNDADERREGICRPGKVGTCDECGYGVRVTDATVIIVTCNAKLCQPGVPFMARRSVTLGYMCPDCGHDGPAEDFTEFNKEA